MVRNTKGNRPHNLRCYACRSKHLKIGTHEKYKDYWWRYMMCQDCKAKGQTSNFWWGEPTNAGYPHMVMFITPKANELGETANIAIARTLEDEGSAEVLAKRKVINSFNALMRGVGMNEDISQLSADHIVAVKELALEATSWQTKEEEHDGQGNISIESRIAAYLAEHEITSRAQLTPADHEALKLIQQGGRVR